MKQSRQEDISLHHYIRYEVLRDFFEIEKHVPLTYLKDISRESGSAVYQMNSSMIPTPNGLGRGWAYIDQYGEYTEQQNSIIVYDRNGAIITDGYDIDYVDGRIIFPDKTVVPVTVTYKWFYVAVVDEWDLVQAAGAPVIVVDLYSFHKEGFQLGGGKKVPRKVNLHIFSSSQAERDDLNEAIYDGLYLKNCPLQEFNHGTMLDWDGRWNSAYTYSVPNGYSFLNFDNVKARNVYPRLLGIPGRDMTQLSDLNRFRSRISFEMFHWEEAM